tara:strand:- start:6289 stop:6840 length:552 start_codon:yes stop_codon:yes gene_type:complete
MDENSLIVLVQFLKPKDIYSYYSTSKTEKDKLAKYVQAYKIYMWWYSMKTRQWIDKVKTYIFNLRIMPHRTQITLPENYYMNYEFNRVNTLGIGYPYCPSCIEEYGRHWKFIANCATYEVEGFKMKYALPTLRFHCQYCFNDFQNTYNHEYLRNPIYTTYNSKKFNVLHYIDDSDSDEIYDEY